MSLFLFDALYPARQAQWNRVPVLMHEVVMSHPLTPERGLQVPHFGGGVGFARAREVVVRRRVVRRVSFIVKGF
jgi:hypothetical protein